MSNQSNVPPFEQIGKPNELMLQQMENMSESELDAMIELIEKAELSNDNSDHVDILDPNAPDIFGFEIPVISNNKVPKHDVLDLGEYYKKCMSNSCSGKKVKTPIPLLPKEIRSKDEYRFTETQMYDQCVKLMQAIHIKSKNLPVFYQRNVADKAAQYIMKAAEHLLHAYSKNKIKEKIHHATLAMKCMAEANMVLTVMYKSCLNNNGRAFIMFPYAKMMLGLERFILSNKTKLAAGQTEYAYKENQAMEYMVVILLQ